MNAYVLVRSSDIKWGEDLVRYLEQVDETFERHGGTILAQGFAARVLEGADSSFHTLLSFPDEAAAAAWYDGADYLSIRHLRHDSSTSVGVILAGAPSGYRAVHQLGPQSRPHPQT